MPVIFCRFCPIVRDLGHAENSIAQERIFCRVDDFTPARLGKAPLVIRSVQTDPRTRKPEFFTCNSLVSYIIGAPLLAKDQWLGVWGYYTMKAHRFTSCETELFGSLITISLIALNAIFTASTAKICTS
jgi:hypothetical protein